MANELMNGTKVGFDLSRVETTRSDDGMPMTVIHPSTRRPLLDGDKNPITITMRGQYSDAFIDTNRDIQEERALLRGRAIQRNQPIPEVTDEDMFNGDTRVLVACTVAWTFTELDGQPFPCNEMNAKILWERRGFRWLRRPAIDFMMEPGNFLSEGSTSSSATHGTASA